MANATEDRPAEAVLMRYDNLLADAGPERCPVAVNRLFRDAAAGDEGAAPPG